MDVLHLEINPATRSDVDAAGVRDTVLGLKRDRLPICVVSRPAAVELGEKRYGEVVR